MFKWSCNSPSIVCITNIPQHMKLEPPDNSTTEELKLAGNLPFICPSIPLFVYLSLYPLLFPFVSLYSNSLYLLTDLVPLNLMNSFELCPIITTITPTRMPLPPYPFFAKLWRAIRNTCWMQFKPRDAIVISSDYISLPNSAIAMITTTTMITITTIHKDPRKSGIPYITSKR